MPGRVRVYMACSLDGFIAGPNEELDWLEHGAPAPDAPTQALGFAEFMAQVGAMLMGRNTHDLVKRFGAWHYGEIPVLVATRRELDPAAPSVRAVQGDIGELIAQAKAAAGEGDVYLDGGDVVRQALEADLVDELCITMVPMLLGEGIPLWRGLGRRIPLQAVDHRSFGGMVQLTLRPDGR